MLGTMCNCAQQILAQFHFTFTLAFTLTFTLTFTWNFITTKNLQSLGPQEPALVLPLPPELDQVSPHRPHRWARCCHHGCSPLALLFLQVTLTN